MSDPIRLTAVLGSVTPPGRLRRALAEALDRTVAAGLAEAELIDLAQMRIAFHHHYLGVERHLRDVLSFFGAHTLPTAAYLSGRDFVDGAPGKRAESELDALLAAAVTVAGALSGAAPLGPAPWQRAWTRTAPRAASGAVGPARCPIAA